MNEASKDNENPLSICIVAHFAFGAMSGGSQGHVGGVERQTTLMARWLANRGHTVSLVVWDEGQQDNLVIDGVRVIKLCRRDAGTPGLRFFHPRWSSLCRALRQADAQVYYFNAAEAATGQIARWCEKRGRKFVYSVASDPACDSSLSVLKTRRERLLYRYGIRSANRIVVQSRVQANLLRTGFGLDSVLLPMPCEAPTRASECGTGEAPRVIWVGRIAPMKRLEMFLDVAEMLPNVTFEVIGAANQNSQYVERLNNRASELRNVIVRGRVERAQMNRAYEGATCLCCTSTYEGFPNTFLEAWSHGVPVVSTVDPNDLIVSHGMGGVAHDVDEFVAAISGIVCNEQIRAMMSANACRYFEENHLIEKAMPRFEALFLSLMAEQAAQ